MLFLIFGCIIFFSTHLYSSFRSRLPGQDIRGRLGYIKYVGLYSIFSGIGFVLIIWGYGLARPALEIYTPPAWGRTVATAVMLPALMLLMAAYGPRGYIKQFVRNPMLLGVILWSIGHLLANGELNSLILFGSFLTYAIIDWLAGLGRPQSVLKLGVFGDIYAIIVGAILYYLLIKYLHPMMFGVSVLT